MPATGKAGACTSSAARARRPFANCPAIGFVDVRFGCWPVGTGHPCFGCTEQGTAFHKPIHALATVKTLTPPTAFPTVEGAKGWPADPAAVAIIAGIGGALIGAGAVAASRMRGTPADQDDASQPKSWGRRSCQLTGARSSRGRSAARRRRALRFAAGDAQTLTLARPDHVASPQAVGILYNSTLCVGCKACVAACKAANGAPAVVPATLADWNQGEWDSAEDLDGRTLNVIKAYVNGTREVKNREIDGFAFVKRHCLHCIDPSCVSVCPVSAMQKHPVTGIVTNNKDACMGCRYCSCLSFGVPFDPEPALAVSTNAKCAAICRPRAASRRAAAPVRLARRCSAS